MKRRNGNRHWISRKVSLAVLIATVAPMMPARAENAAPLYAGRIDDFRGKTIEQKVRLLQDREEIRDLIALYAQRAAHRVSMADLFTDDGAFINRPDSTTPPMEVRGRAALNAFFNGLGTQPQQPLPMIHNFLIAVNGDEARALSSIEVRIVHAGQVVDGSGYYQDRFRRVNGRWLFVERDCTFFNMVPIQAPGIEPSPALRP